MKNIYLLPTCLLFFNSFAADQAAAQCPPGNLTLSNQADVDNLVSAYPNCTELPGDLTISSSPNNVITDLTPLSQITVVAGKISIPQIFNDLSLDGLENIQSARSLIIGSESDSPQLWYATLAALGNISGHLDSLFIGNMNTENLETNFPNITSIGYLRIARNPNITSIPSFPALVTVQDITVSNCQALEHLILPETIDVIDFPDEVPIFPFNSGIYIQSNPALQTITCNANLIKLHDLLVIGNDELETIAGFQSLDSIRNQFGLSGKIPTIFDSFHNLSYIRSASLTLDAEGITEPFAEMYISVGENASTVEIGNGGLSIGANMVSTLWITGPVISSVGNVQLSGPFQTLNGLGYLQEIGGHYSFNCPNLTQLPNSPQLSVISGDLAFFGGQNSLINFEGLNGLSSIQGDFRFGSSSQSANYALQSLNGLEMLTEVGGALGFRNLLALSDIQALANLTTVGGELNLSNLPMLSNDGVSLPNFTSSGGIRIVNTAFTEVPEMPVFTSLNGDLFIDNNPLLSEIDFNEALAFSGQFTLTNNPEMSSCNSPSVCMLIDLSSADVIENNGTNCNSLDEVLAGCIVSTNNVELSDWNCFQSQPGELTISSDRALSQARIILYDLQGKRQLELQLYINSGNNTFSIPKLASGVYLLQINIGGQSMSEKIWLQ